MLEFLFLCIKASHFAKTQNINKHLQLVNCCEVTDLLRLCLYKSSDTTLHSEQWKVTFQTALVLILTIKNYNYKMRWCLSGCLWFNLAEPTLPTSMKYLKKGPIHLEGSHKACFLFQYLSPFQDGRLSSATTTTRQDYKFLIE